jgi:hypothetical protein
LRISSGQVALNITVWRRASGFSSCAPLALFSSLLAEGAHIAQTLRMMGSNPSSNLIVGN